MILIYGDRMMRDSALVLTGEARLQLQNIYVDHHSWLKSWLIRKLGNDALALDLAQDAFMRLICSRIPTDAIRMPRAYLTTVAHGLVVNHWRRQSIERAYLDALAARGEMASPSPEEAKLALEALEEIDALLDGLPARSRQAFLLSQLDGWPYAKIARHLGITVNMVQKAMIRALQGCYRASYG
ncbi:sigma-70 family RNA polymerase sigma factor [Xanthomonas arboricola]|nr:sigma-70 family RNA polymerase sigma factor [Xanthomonas arboricola]MBB3848784.1 RNA polymerase sigma-70 factor (ECF subfamily) [Xanthomonas arboricola]MEB1609067.1 sigma-70 family RNA polymerase sigma factor [Xanthomonas campestris pv. campestris]